MFHCRVIYIDRDSFWWLAEAVSNNPRTGDIQLIEPYSPEYKSQWQKIIEKIGENAQQMVLFYENCQQCYEPLNKTDNSKEGSEVVLRNVIPA